ncbi:MAG: limonene-1,2-epoxide hydrolase family protein [Ilumatobacteraceae bacterium]
MEPADVVDEFIRRVVGGDCAGACELVTDDIEYDNVPVGKNIGPDALTSFLSAMMSGFDEVVFVTHRQVSNATTVINERSDRFRIGDQWLELPVAGVFEVTADGRISLWRDYFDMSTFQRELARITPS